MASTYLVNGNGLMTKKNLDSLQLMAGVLNAVKGPWAVGGDWNCTPEELQQTGWLKQIGGVIVAPKAPTCGDRVIDFFVVAECLHHATPCCVHRG